MTATTTRPAIGQLVTARPWRSGVEQEPRAGIVVGGTDDGEFATVWFHTLGELSREDDGYAIQMILWSKCQVTGTLADWKPETLKRLAKRVKRHLHSLDVYVLSAIHTAYRAATAA